MVGMAPSLAWIIHLYGGRTAAGEMQGKLPAGWKLEPGPDETVRVTVATRSSRSSGLPLVAAGLCCEAMAGVTFVSLQGGTAGWRGLRLTLLLPLGLLLVGQGLRAAFGREEWRVGADLLEVTQGLFGLRRARCFRGASLRLVSSEISVSPRQRRLSRAARVGRGSSHAGGSWWGLFAMDQRGKRCLYSTSRGSSRPDEVRALGEFLSERTGWPLVRIRQEGQR
jgi:hypothetical protein